MEPGRRTLALKAVLDALPGATSQARSAATGKSALVLTYAVMGKMFAVLSVRAEEFVVLKCDPHLAEQLREKYAGVGKRTHLDPRYWIAVHLNADVPAKEIKRLAAHAYEQVCAKLTAKQKAELAALS
jgi:predicted DNA-binding protein (MmcQ/YjbR family)